MFRNKYRRQSRTSSNPFFSPWYIFQEAGASSLYRTIANSTVFHVSFSPDAAPFWPDTGGVTGVTAGAVPVDTDANSKAAPHAIQVRFVVLDFTKILASPVYREWIFM